MANLIGSQDDFDGPEPDAIAQGWVRPEGAEPVDAIFVLAGRQLGIGRVGRVTPPVWLKLDELVNLDAIGDPVGDRQEIEISMEDHSVVGAEWPLPFCDAVVQVLQQIAGIQPHPAPEPVAAPEPEPAPAPEPQPEAVPAPVAEVPEVPEAPAPVPVAPVPETAAPEPVAAPDTAAPEPAAATTAASAAPDVAVADGHETRTLELEDVVYLGGFPSQSKRRKRCLVVMSNEKLDLTGPHDLALSIDWNSVQRIEVQNADEARFRLNTKIHRDASALVLECDDSVTVLLEARECPTIALRSAISQLLDGRSVEVI